MKVFEIVFAPLTVAVSALCTVAVLLAVALRALLRRCCQPLAAADVEREDKLQTLQDSSTSFVPAHFAAAEPDAEPDSEHVVPPANGQGVLKVTWLLLPLCLVALLCQAARRANPSAAVPETTLQAFEVSESAAGIIVNSHGFHNQTSPLLTEAIAHALTFAGCQANALAPEVTSSSVSSAVAQPPSAGVDGKRLTVQLQRQAVSLSKVGGVMYYKSAYYGNINMAGQTFRMVFDTGSGHLVLPTTYCHSTACRIHRRYKRSKSMTAVDMDYDGTVVLPTDPRDQITVGYGTGDVTGVFIEEMVCMENSSLSAWTPEERDVKYDISTKDMAGSAHLGCMRMRFIAATKMSDDPFSHFEFDGVLGLALPGASQTPEFNFVHTLSRNMQGWGSETSRVFAIFLGSSDLETSEITFGGYEEKHLDENGVVWNDVYHPETGHWMLKVKSVHIDDDLLDFCEDGTCKAVVDTGTTLLGVPSECFSDLYRFLWHPTPADGSCLGDGPNLHVEFESGFTVTLTPADFAHAQPYQEDQIEANAELPYPWGSPFSGGEEDRFGPSRWDLQCKPMMMSLDLAAPLGPKLLILGEPVLRKYYTIYDTEQQRIGFGNARHVPRDSVQDGGDDLGEDWFWEDPEENEEDS